MRYEHIAAAYRRTIWAILPEKLSEIRAFLELKCSGGDVALSDIKALAAERKSATGVQRNGAVAIVPVFGTICQRAGLLDQASGGCSTEEIGQRLDTLAADKSIGAICMLFDSPGGGVSGVEELGRKIASIRGRKRIVAQVDSCAASAAYWLASQCSEISCTPGGNVGSIGVFAAHEDHAKELDEQGVKTTLISSSKYKTEAHPFGPLDAEARAEIQSKVDAYHAMFISAVARGRGVSEGKVKANFGQGRMVMAQDAVSRGMCDNVQTFQQLLTRMADGGSSPTAATLQRDEIRARAAQVTRQCSAEGVGDGSSAREQAAARAAEVERESRSPSSAHWTREEAAARARQVERECGLPPRR